MEEATIPIKAGHAADRRKPGSRGGRPCTFDPELHEQHHTPISDDQASAQRARSAARAGAGPKWVEGYRIRCFYSSITWASTAVWAWVRSRVAVSSVTTPAWAYSRKRVIASV